MLLLFLAFGPGQIGVRDEDEFLFPWDLDEGHDPISYGFSGLNGFQDEPGLEDVHERFHLSAFHTSTRSPNYAEQSLLPLVEEENLSVNLRLVGGPEYYTDGSGDFDLEAWKAELEPWRDADLDDFIDDGTLAHHMMLDDLSAFSGRGPTASELDEMAAFSDDVLPGLDCAVREEPADLPVPSSGTYEHLAASAAQYRSQDGDVEEFALLQMQVAADLGIGLITGMNLADGGDGSRGQPGWDEGNWAMSAQEITFNGHVLTGVPEVRMVISWEYDGEEAWSDGTIGADYFDEGEVAEALEALGARAAGGE
ncbi:MAG: hypothetical protein GY884_10335 [Proteobacteria bacterium]|nr:hypothetical protein [Pseudomonadota bacterium]